ncbi:MAG TPA: CHAD domain-containing protein, partial [Acidimicrobiales bacterium]
MPGSPVEREVKLAVDDDFVVPDLSRFEDLGSAAIVEKLAPLELTATYYDTVDLRLLRAGVTLRHRRGDTAGDGTWTLKLPAGGRGGSPAGAGATFDRHELDWSGAADVMAPEALDLVVGLRQRRPLTEVAVVHTLRARLAVRRADGSAALEIDDDRVTATTGAASVRFRQVEVERTAGDPILVEAVAGGLCRAGARPGPAQPKVAQILADRLAALTPVLPAPRRAESTMGEVTAAALSSALERLVSHDPGVRLGRDPEAVHQARVAIRRLRADLSMLRGVLDDTWVARVRDELRGLAAVFGQVRDADVLVGRLEAYRPSLRPSEIDGFDRLIGRL